MKTTLVDKVSFSVKGYAALNPDFPDEPTSDQFFDNIQFDAYRELGYTIADLMLNSEIPAEIRTDRNEGGTMRTFLNDVQPFDFVT